MTGTPGEAFSAHLTGTRLARSKEVTNPPKITAF
jgi:hypothetical protein